MRRFKKLRMFFSLFVLMNNIFGTFKNKYFLATVSFIVWMLFFDRNDLMSQYDYRTQLNKLEAEKEFYIKETQKASQDLDELSTNKQKLEKFAREKYLMKKENEDVFVIIQEAPEKSKSIF